MQGSATHRAGRRRTGKIGFGRLLGSLALGALIFLHVALLWRRLADPSLLEAAVIGRWALALLLLAAGWSLHRREVSLVRGRSAVVLWLLILLLHVQLPASVEVGAKAEAAAQIVVLELLLLVLTVALLMRRGASAADPGAGRRRWGDLVPRARGLDLLPSLLCRPPPALLAR